ncbi:MAG: hypothetical protein H6618_07240, partial [Deltaproteobacteria bacterium]|nr:hypothetical protein [Deltaproteobacteria bacterium]
DGHWKSGLNHIAIFLNFQQNKNSYVQKIVLATGDKKTLGIRYLTPEDKTKEGYPSFVLFDQVDLRYSQKYFIIIQVLEKSTYKIYRHTIDKEKIKPELFKRSFLPAKIADDFDQSHHGMIFSSYYFNEFMIKQTYCEKIGLKDLSGGCYLANFPHIKIRAIDPNGDFLIDVSFIKSDINENHYVRYVFITDPVGRLISVTQRTFDNDEKKTTVSLKPLTENEWKNEWGINIENTGSIVACPYIMVFSEDIQNGLFQSIIWLH